MGISFAEIVDGQQGDTHFLQEVGNTGVYSCSTSGPDKVQRSAVILHTATDGTQPFLYEGDGLTFIKNQSSPGDHQNGVFDDFDDHEEHDLKVFLPWMASAKCVEWDNVNPIQCKSHMMIQMFINDDEYSQYSHGLNLGALVPSNNDQQHLLFFVRKDGDAIVKTPLNPQKVHGLKHLFTDTSASKDETDDKDNVPTIANNAQIDFEARVRSTIVIILLLVPQQSQPLMFMIFITIWLRFRTFNTTGFYTEMR